MKSGIKYFILKVEHSTRTLLVHSLVTLFRFLFSFQVSRKWQYICGLALQLEAGRKNNRELRQECLQCILGPFGRRTASVPTEESWRAINEGFKNTARFPNCIGSVEGKHCASF